MINIKNFIKQSQTDFIYLIVFCYWLSGFTFAFQFSYPGSGTEKKIMD